MNCHWDWVRQPDLAGRGWHKLVESAAGPGASYGRGSVRFTPAAYTDARCLERMLGRHL